MRDQPLLSIVIPTYNREKDLEKALTTIFEQITDDLKGKIEILVSDNNSYDNTQNILENFKNISNKKVINFNFLKNDRNIGADRNFIKLINKSKGKFCWIFGDDEFLLENGLSKIIEVLDKNLEVGLLHISNKEIKNIKKYEKVETQDFIKKINYMISFITANIFNKRYIDSNIDYEKFKDKNLIQEIYYFQAILEAKNNIYIDNKIFVAKKSEVNESYKFFETFGKNQNSIFNYFIDKGLEKKTIDFINKKMLREFFPVYILNLDKKNEWENEDVYKEMKLTFSQYLEFWIFCFPLIKFPKLIKKPYFLAIRILNKLIRIKGR